MSAPDLLSRVLYRDGLMLVIDKPAGLPVHAKPGTKKGEGDPSLEDYFHQLRFGLPRDPSLAHRLDRDTTGCLILGRHPKALRKLHKLFLEARIEKTYWAICRGAPEKPSGTIDVAMKKGTERSGWKMRVATTEEDGIMTAVTTYRTIKSAGGLSFIEAKPKTGRTHQIRVHLSSIGAPILGDPLYGDLTKEERSGPIMLHARRVVVPISKNKDPVTVEAPPPQWMAAMLAQLEARG
ncbi:MAG: RNA pseudouridine synthase [Parvularculaceae bacterium]|nr:RNA pseudouridine synthase [Parvularculaceae bacterium]